MFQKPHYATPDRLNWSVIGVFAAMHFLALGAIWTFSWQGLVAFVLAGFITGSMGISFAYHRLHTHSGFKCPKWLTYLATFVACLAFEGGPIFWVSTHRYHHKMSDKPLDPHSPRDGFWWSHMGWLMYEHPVLSEPGAREKITADLHADPVIVWMEQNNVLIALGGFVALYTLGYWMQGPAMALSLLFWGGFLRVVSAWHQTWLVNSMTHMVGYRNYNTAEDSSNFWLVALLSFGEGWHNNHHGDPRTARFNHRWFEFDITYAWMQPLLWLGIITDFVHPRAIVKGLKLPQDSPEDDTIPANILSGLRMPAQAMAQ
ncbi:MAG: fatty acid desaturase [Vampirovibrionales bacterium]|nr:fatty acid desaturase [Vampirovibrionales bacterium]